MTATRAIAGVLAPPPVIVGATFFLELGADRLLHTSALVSSPLLRWGLAVTGPPWAAGRSGRFEKPEPVSCPIIERWRSPVVAPTG